MFVSFQKLKLPPSDKEMSGKSAARHAVMATEKNAKSVKRSLILFTPISV